MLEKHNAFAGVHNIAKTYTQTNEVETASYWIKLEGDCIKYSLRGQVTATDVQTAAKFIQSMLFRNPGVKKAMFIGTEIENYDLAVRQGAKRIIDLCKQYKLRVCVVSEHVLANTMASTVALVAGVNIKIVKNYADAVNTFLKN